MCINTKRCPLTVAHCDIAPLPTVASVEPPRDGKPAVDEEVSC